METKIECCGAKRDTPFCPLCGKMLHGDKTTILGLLQHINESIARCERNLEASKKNNFIVIDKKKKWIADNEKAVMKWQSWRDIVTGFMNKPNPSKDFEISYHWGDLLELSANAAKIVGKFAGKKASELNGRDLLEIKGCGPVTLREIMAWKKEKLGE